MESSLNAIRRGASKIFRMDYRCVSNLWRLRCSLLVQTHGHVPGALSTLMTPASQFEKFAIKWLIAVPVYILTFCLIAYVADWIRVYSSYWMFDIEVRPVNVTKILFTRRLI